MMPLPPRYLQPVPLPTPFRPGDPRHLDPLGLHVRDTTDPHKVRDRLVDIGVLRKNRDGTYSPYLPMKADLVDGKVPASQLPEGRQGVTEVLVDGASVVSGGTASISLAGKINRSEVESGFTVWDGLLPGFYPEYFGPDPETGRDVWRLMREEDHFAVAWCEAGVDALGLFFESEDIPGGVMRLSRVRIPTAADLELKVDKEQDKGLSSNDYTSAEKTKLSGIETGAQKNVAPVAPSTDASAAGKPADAKATGDQLVGKLSRVEAGLSAWSISPTPQSVWSVQFESDNETRPEGWCLVLGGERVDFYEGGETETTLLFTGYTATRTWLPTMADLAAKQDTIIDLATIRAGAAAGATAYQKPSTGIPATDLAAAVQTSLGKADTALQSAPVLSVNGQTGAVALSSGDIPVNPGATPSVLDALNLLANRIPYAIGATITASAQLADRTGNRVVPLATNTENIVLTFPNGYADYLRDFLVLVTNTAGNTGNITFTAPAGATVYGDGFTHSPASEETWLYSVTEVAADTFWVKSVKMEVAQ